MTDVNNDWWLEPPDYEENSIYRCHYCERGIFEDEGYYKIENIIICEDCLEDNYKHYA